MRTRTLVAVLSVAGSAAASSLVACGNGDDVQIPVPGPDASTDGSKGGDGAAAAKEGGGDAGAMATSLKHVYVIMMENHAQAQIIGDTTDAPNLNKLANKYGVAT